MIQVLIILYVLLIIIVVAGFIVWPVLNCRGHGDLARGAGSVLAACNASLLDYFPPLQILLYVLAGGFAAMVLFRQFIPLLTVDDDAIEMYYPFLRFFRLLPGMRKTQARTRIHFFDAEAVFSDFLATGNGEYLFTAIVSGPRQTVFRPGFIGYFEIMDLIETRAPQAKWDGRTRLLVANHDRGGSVYRTEQALKKELRQRLKAAAPSWWQRQKLMRKMRGKRQFLFRSLLPPPPDDNA
ncbi:MAG TPA: hypothetical protein VM658_21685 [bacterium]|nr:hypothetical protein [bacterium]